MSSFLVSAEGLSMLADGIFDSVNSGKIANFPVSDDSLNDYFENMNVNEIFEQLNYLNAYALNCRYDDDIDENTYADGIVFIPEYTIDAYLKMLDCFSYQCCEGDTINTRLYKIINNLIKKVEKHVNRQGNPLYDEANWG